MTGSTRCLGGKPAGYWFGAGSFLTSFPRELTLVENKDKYIPNYAWKGKFTEAVEG
jgi:hypothetical protein